MGFPVEREVATRLFFLDVSLYTLPSCLTISGREIGFRTGGKPRSVRGRSTSGWWNGLRGSLPFGDQKIHFAVRIIEECLKDP